MTRLTEQIAYDAYREEIQKRTGRQLPPWEALSADEAMAWFEAAEAVMSRAASWIARAATRSQPEPRA